LQVRPVERLQQVTTEASLDNQVFPKRSKPYEEDRKPRKRSSMPLVTWTLLPISPLILIHQPSFGVKQRKASKELRVNSIWQ